MGQCQSSTVAQPPKLSKGGLNRPRRNSGLVLIEETGVLATPKSAKSCTKSAWPQKLEDSSKTTGNAERNSLNDDSKTIIKRCLLRSGVFNDEVNKLNISSHDIDRIVDAFHVEHYKENQFLFQKDDYPCDKLYIVKSGVFRGIDNCECKAIMREKDMMGELDFFHQSPRYLSVCVGGSNASAYCLNKRDFKAIVEKGRDLRNIKMLDLLSETQKYLLKDQVKLSNYIRGDIPLRKHAEIPYFYIVLSGQIAVSGDFINPSYPSCSEIPRNRTFSTTYSTVSSLNYTVDNEIVVLNPGDYFGEESFVSGIAKSSKSFMAINEVTLCLMTKTLFDDVNVFSQAKNFIINDIEVRKGENAMRDIRKKKSFVKFSSLQEDEGGSEKKDIYTGIKSGGLSSKRSPRGTLLIDSVSSSIVTETDTCSNTSSNVGGSNNVSADLLLLQGNEEVYKQVESESDKLMRLPESQLQNNFSLYIPLCGVY